MLLCMRDFNTDQGHFASTSSTLLPVLIASRSNFSNHSLATSARTAMIVAAASLKVQRNDINRASWNSSTTLSCLSHSHGKVSCKTSNVIIPAFTIDIDILVVFWAVACSVATLTSRVHVLLMSRWYSAPPNAMKGCHCRPSGLRFGFSRVLWSLIKDPRSCWSRSSRGRTSPLDSSSSDVCDDDSFQAINASEKLATSIVNLSFSLPLSSKINKPTASTFGIHQFFVDRVCGRDDIIAHSIMPALEDFAVVSFGLFERLWRV